MISDTLGDGRIMVVMTPREAVHVYDNLLDPEDFPWTRTEAQETVMKCRIALHAQILEGTKELLVGIAALPEE